MPIERPFRYLEDLSPSKGAPFSVQEFSFMTGMSESFVREAIAAGELAAVRLGRVWRIPYRAALRYLRTTGFGLHT